MNGAARNFRKNRYFFYAFLYCFCKKHWGRAILPFTILLLPFTICSYHSQYCSYHSQYCRYHSQSVVTIHNTVVTIHNTVVTIHNTVVTIHKNTLSKKEEISIRSAVDMVGITWLKKKYFRGKGGLEKKRKK